MLDFQAAKKAKQALLSKPVTAKSADSYDATAPSPLTENTKVPQNKNNTPAAMSMTSLRSSPRAPNEASNDAAQAVDNNLSIPTPTSIEVFVRIRPLLPHEEDAASRGATSILTVAGENVVSIDHPAKQLQCQYDHVFSPTSSQDSIFSKVQSCAVSVAGGYNATIFAYGQTGSGKTHTMFGPDGYQVSRSSYGGPNHATLTPNAGVIPRSIVQIFKSLSSKSLGITSMSVYVSFVQVYNENLYDMLRDPRRSSALEIHEEPGAGIYVSGLSEYAVRNAGDCLALVKMGEDNRAIRETHMNTASSRSHSLFQIVVEQTRIEDGATGEKNLRSKFNLVDLAGSEKWDTRKDGLRNEDQILELTNINLSLYTLGRCIAALAKNGKALKDDPDGIPGHVPFRESKLTRLLQDSLGGNSKTMLIATLSPASDCLDETVSTLRFADRAHQVMTFVRKNEKRPVDHALVQRLQSEVARLRALLEEKGGGGGSPSLAPSTSGMVSAAPSGGGEEQLAQLAQAMEKIKELGTENNTLRRRLGMPEVAVTTQLGASSRLGTPQRHTPRGFAIVGGGNSELANELRRGGGGGEETKASLNAMRGSHERLSSIMADVEGVTSRFFAFDIEEDELKEKVQKLMKVFKKEKKGYVELYKGMDEGNGIFNAHSGARDGVKKGKKKNSPERPSPGGGAGLSPGGGGGGSPMPGPTSASKFNGHINNSPSFRPPVISAYNAGGGASGSAAAGKAGVAYRIRGKPGEMVKGGGASTLSPQREGEAEMRVSGPMSVGGGGGGRWVVDEEDEEDKLRKELKEAKGRMEKQIKMQEWLEKKEGKALAALEADEVSRKEFADEQKKKAKEFRKRAKQQKKKLEKYYNQLRTEMGQMDIAAQQSGEVGGGGGGGEEDEDYGDF